MESSELLSYQQRTLIGDSPLQVILKDNLDNFSKLGFPDRHNENWHYTNLKAKIRPFKIDIQKPACLLHDQKSSFSNNRIIFENGMFSTCNSTLPKGVSLRSYSKNDHEIPKKLLSLLTATGDAVSSFANALLEEIIHIEINDSFESQFPLEILYFLNEESSGHFLRPFVVIDIAPFTKIDLVENLVGQSGSDYFFHSTTTVNVGDSANVSHLLYTNRTTDSIIRCNINSTIQKDANYSFFNITHGHALQRVDLTPTIVGKNSCVKLYGLSLLKDKDHVDTFVTIDHRVGDTNSEQLFKVVASGESRGIFTGKIIIAKDAQKVDSTQLSKNLLLSKKAQIFTRPQLEVNADDVKCSHGATVGQMSSEELFYLMARGVKKEEAEKLLSHAFIQDVVDRIPSDNLAKLVSSRLFDQR